MKSHRSRYKRRAHASRVASPRSGGGAVARAARALSVSLGVSDLLPPSVNGAQNRQSFAVSAYRFGFVVTVVELSPVLSVAPDASGL